MGMARLKVQQNCHTPAAEILIRHTLHLTLKHMAYLHSPILGTCSWFCKLQTEPLEGLIAWGGHRDMDA